MEQENQISAQTEVKPAAKVKNPARKWLIVSACGLAICLGALGYHFITGGSAVPDPLPKKVLAQTFGFTPYYFTGNKPPAHLHLKAESSKFLGNALSFTMANNHNQTLTILEKTPPEKPSATEAGGDSVTSALGTGTIGAVQGGHITATFTTKDKTYLTVESTDFLNADTIKNILNDLVAIDKATGEPALVQ